MANAIAMRVPVVLLVGLTAASVFPTAGSISAVVAAPPVFDVRVESTHRWRPPFRLEKVGQPLVLTVESTMPPSPAVYTIEARNKGTRVTRQPVLFPAMAPFAARVSLGVVPLVDEVILTAETGAPANRQELVRKPIKLPAFEAEAIATADRLINPVDLGAVFVPHDWLLLGAGQSATLKIAALSRLADLPGAVVKSWFASNPGKVEAAALSLKAGERAERDWKLPESPHDRDRDVFKVVIEDGRGAVLWQKDVPIMLVPKPPRRPRFGATYEHLRYDASISVRQPGTGKFSSMRYEDGWDPSLQDIVVSLPNGGRFVFWRGSSYIPFWAGPRNTGFCYEWAEIISQPSGAVDCVEPLMDKELRYSRAEIVESTASRIHIRWRYQSTDFQYKVWGDEAVEDYYFYPDGFGTRVVNLKADPRNDYELSEFIMITPQGAYPFEVLPVDPVDALYVDGRVERFRFPNPVAIDAATKRLRENETIPAIYRCRFAKDQALSAVYFNPRGLQLPGVVFAPFFDGGAMVTPCYWGSHWPLARGNSTGSKIDDRIQFTPTHNSVMSWAGKRPEPLSTASYITLDTLGQSRPMTVRRWAWLIGMSDAGDDRLRDWAKSFTTPPSLALRGASLAFDGYRPERRAIGIDAITRDVQVTIKPATRCVNPVFEFSRELPREIVVNLAGQAVTPERYAWDGRVLWLDATIETPTELRVTFGGPDHGR